jgi:hypothetical protein
LNQVFTRKNIVMKEEVPYYLIALCASALLLIGIVLFRIRKGRRK